MKKKPARRSPKLSPFRPTTVVVVEGGAMVATYTNDPRGLASLCLIDLDAEVLEDALPHHVKEQNLEEMMNGTIKDHLGDVASRLLRGYNDKLKEAGHE